MRYEVAEYYNSLRLSIPKLIELGRGHKYKVSKGQIEAACEYVYLQIHEKGFDTRRVKLAKYILNQATKIKHGNYYKINTGDPVLLDDITAIRSLEANLGAAHEEIEVTTQDMFKHKRYALYWQIALYLGCIVSFIIGNMRI